MPSKAEMMLAKMFLAEHEAVKAEIKKENIKLYSANARANRTPEQKEARRLDGKKWREKNKEAIKKYAKKYGITHRKQILEKQKEKRASMTPVQRAARLAVQLRYRQKRRAKILADKKAAQDKHQQELI